MAAGLPRKKECMAGSCPLLLALFVAVALAGMATPSAAAVYKVGDAAGWTILGRSNYTAWAASKTFHVGDVIVFEYNREFHNVMVVSEADYKTCNAESPEATYTTGNDSIPLKSAGHHFFLCGIPAHCDSGQRVDVNVLRQASQRAPGPSPPIPSPPAGGSSGATGGGDAPPPPKNSAAAGGFVVWWVVAVLAVAIGGNLS